MTNKTIRIAIDVDYDAEKADPDEIVDAVDTMIKTGSSTTGLFDEISPIEIGEAFLAGGLNKREEATVTMQAEQFLIDESKIETSATLKSQATSPKSGVYIKLFHGRKDPDEHLDDWGSTGPIIGPLGYAHCTYASDIKCGTVDGENGPQLHIINEMVYYDGVYYGDWSVTTLNMLRVDDHKDIVAMDETKTQPPGKQKYSEQRPNGGFSHNSTGRITTDKTRYDITPNQDHPTVVFEWEGVGDTPDKAAADAWDSIRSPDVIPASCTVFMPDGTRHDVDLDHTDNEDAENA